MKRPTTIAPVQPATNGSRSVFVFRLSGTGDMSLTQTPRAAHPCWQAFEWTYVASGGRGLTVKRVCIRRRPSDRFHTPAANSGRFGRLTLLEPAASRPAGRLLPDCVRDA